MRPDLQGKIMVLPFQTKGAGQTAAAILENLDLKTRNELQKFYGLPGDPQGPEMARVMVAHLQGDFSETCI
jgi:hypothetical protein